MVIMKRVRLVTGDKNIFARINDQLDSWKGGAFDELVCDSYAGATGYLGRDRRNQSADQHHRTLKNIVLRGKLREAVRLVCERESGGVLLPNEMASDKTGIMEETATTVLAKKHPHKKLFPGSTLEVYDKKPIFITVDIIDDEFE